MPFRFLATIASLVLFSSPVLAWSDLDRMTLSSALADVLASEKPCGLTYKQEAISRFIDSKVPANDMDFPGHLNMQTAGRGFMIKEMSESAKTAHCRQIERVAKSYGFI
jgi:hypothetical protein